MKTGLTVKGHMIHVTRYEQLMHCFRQRCEVFITDSTGVIHQGLINEVQIESGGTPVTHFNITLHDGDKFFVVFKD